MTGSMPTVNAEARALLERGYPHLRLLVDEHPDDAPKKVAKAAAKSVNVIDPLYHVRWPRQVAARFLWLFGNVEDRRKRHEQASVAREAPTAKEAEATIARVMETASKKLAHVYRYDVADWVLLHEAFVGPDAVVNGVTDGLVRAVEALAPGARAFEASFNPKTERYSKASPQTNYLAAYTILPLGGLYLRASAKTVASSKKRLEALLDAHSDLLSHWPLTSLVMLLRGREGIAAIPYKWHPQEAFLFSGDPDYVREGVANLRGDVDVDAYAIWIGGEATLATYGKAVKKVRRDDAAHVAEGLGFFASPAVVPAMVELAAKKCEPAVAWLLEHLDWTRTELEKIAAAGKKPGEAAAAVLAQAGVETASGAPAQADPAKKKRKPTPRAIERAFDGLVDDVVAAVEAVRGDHAKEAAAWQDAADGYAHIRGTMMNEPATEYMGHFFMVDGVGFSDERVTAWDRLSPTDEESARWGAVLEAYG